TYGCTPSSGQASAARRYAELGRAGEGTRPYVFCDYPWVSIDSRSSTPMAPPPTCSLIIRTLPPIPVAPRPTAVNNLPNSTRRAALETPDTVAGLLLRNTLPFAP